MMNDVGNRLLPIAFLFSSIVTFSIGYFLLHDSNYGGFCVPRYLDCINFYVRIGDVMTIYSGALVIIFLVLAVFPSTFKTWKRFGIWSLPLTVVLLLWYPEPRSWDLIQDPTSIVQWVSGFYVFVSLVLIGLSLRKKN